MSFMLDDVGLTHSNGFTALSHISLSAIQGESIALIGPSGAGKTSLLSTIGTAYLPTAGRMQVLGRTASAQSAARELKALRSRIGTVHQAAPIPLRQRVVTAVLAGKLGQWPLWKALASLAYPQDIAGAREALARVQLEDKLFARCDQLSGGQLQRVGIARVLYQQAELILADEPVSALDPALSQATVQLLVREAAARKATLVASLHAVDLALANFARIVGVRDGRLAFDLPAAQVSDAQLQALYAHTDGRAADLPMLHNRLAQRDPASITPTPIQVNACR
ncbi:MULTISPECIES: phosphonate ABC transporter ATP-binding protein [Comamonas]|uniref:ATP-binding cassette domain-containing protein n=1 Tax=Comamonas thiooxydans TaxID=363952 RepID=A0AA42Q5U0_9BURK|nr:ATP-binding cassette domain-containing protein [Comamonas thiooxydans]BCX52782.1 phosphonates import ATP-binding protein PhnC 1 [Comamonas testosteroni]KKI16196.1 phosphonate ABC transporter [Comamonas thiooxydans]MDH1253135.1 ATP-binding cassette domain-containing protein [Comamonas thiooxydans]MDH1336291.1 ATP-binding cassette domain-containing protein [Comamonas thiooxydans]MDH1475520.1 ATP-binding cassette domain-containing protein [Comamonas thiooxydans]